MRLILPTLLIPMVLASQSLCAVHTHSGMHSADLGGHSAIPHFHVGAGHLHTHVRLHSTGGSLGAETAEVPQSGLEAIPDQNARAYYVPDSVSRADNRPASDRLSELLVKLVGRTLPTPSLRAFGIPNADRLSPDRLCGTARIPLFLRGESIRC